jgi:hypothetical protein
MNGSRHKKGGRRRALSDAELLARAGQSLDILVGLAASYDGGAPIMSLPMATEVHKLMTAGGIASTKLRGTRTFPARRAIDPRVISSTVTLVSVRQTAEPPAIEFVPAFMQRPPDRHLAFRQWWRQDLIYCASAAKPGVGPGVIPVRSEDQVPFEEREKLTREALVSKVRNSVGAHTDEEMPAVLDDLEKAWAFGVHFGQHTPNGMLSTAEGTLPVTIGPLPAMLRQIAEEVLVGYERRT